jgi:hypothetical protein
MKKRPKELEVIEKGSRLLVISTMLPGMRLFLGLLSLFPLIAPFELIIRVDWQSYFNVFFLFAGLISAGAVAVSALLLFAALAGLSSHATFDRAKGLFLYWQKAPIVPKKSVGYPLANIKGLEIKNHDWTDGSPGYSLLVIMQDNKAFDLCSSWDKSRMEKVKEQILSFLDAGK